MIIALPTQAILTCNALRNVAAIPKLNPELAAALRSHGDDLIASAVAHIREAEEQAARLASSTRTALAEGGILIPEIGE